jgi:hypothetical protein
MSAQQTQVQFQSESYLTTDGQSANVSWYQATIWKLRPIFPYRPWNLSSVISSFVFLIMGRPI